MMRFARVFLRALFLLTAASQTSLAATPEDCSCSETECPDSATVLLGISENIISPACEEGSVASLEVLNSIDDSGAYEVITWNLGASTWTDTLTSPYKYANASQEEEDVTCYIVPEEKLPVIGDQTQLKVTLNCERTRCKFRYRIAFSCYETGVLTSDTGGGVQVLSDVDDTIVCPNPQGSTDPHSFAGVDTRLEAKELYPGVAELLLGLALGLEEPPANSSSTNDTSFLLNGAYVPARPMLLSARPREASVLAIAQDSGMNVYMEQVGARNSHPSWGTNIDGSMYGTIFDGVSFDEFGETKAKSYNQVSQERPTTKFAFMGDNGQGDVCGAQSMLQSPTGDRMIAVFIHLSEKRENSITECEDPINGTFTLDLPESDIVHYHATHSDAALWAYDQNLISCCSANNVYVAIEEWIACRCDGNCTYELPTGVSEQATRNETLSYCDDLKADQELLKSTLDQCDPQGKCPAPAELPPVGSTTTRGSGATASGTVRIVTLVGLLLTIGLF